MSLKSELRNYIQTRYNRLQYEEDNQKALREINNIAAKFEIKLKS